MPQMQVLDLSPLPREEPTVLEKTLAGFVNRRKENQESDAIEKIYKEYKEKGRNIEDAMMGVNASTLSPTSKVNTMNTLIKARELMATEEKNRVAAVKEEDRFKKTQKAAEDRNKIAEEKNLIEKHKSNNQILLQRERQQENAKLAKQKADDAYKFQERKFGLLSDKSRQEIEAKRQKAEDDLKLADQKLKQAQEKHEQSLKLIEKKTDYLTKKGEIDIGVRKTKGEQDIKLLEKKIEKGDIDVAQKKAKGETEAENKQKIADIVLKTKEELAKIEINRKKTLSEIDQENRRKTGITKSEEEQKKQAKQEAESKTILEGAGFPDEEAARLAKTLSPVSARQLAVQVGKKTPEDEYAMLRVKGVDSYVNTTFEEADIARNMESSLDIAEQAVKGEVSGPGWEAAIKHNPYTQLLVGLSPDEVTLQVANKNMLAGTKGLFGYNPTEREIFLLLNEMLPSIGKSEESNLAGIDALRKTNQIKLMRGAIVDKLTDGGNKYVPDLQRKVAAEMQPLGEALKKELTEKKAALDAKKKTKKQPEKPEEKKIKVRAPDGKYWMMTEENIKAAEKAKGIILERVKSS